METIYLISATVGGTILVCQVLLMFLGFGEHGDAGDHDVTLDHDVHVDVDGHEVHTGDHHDTAHEHEASWFARNLSFRSLVAFFTFFGLAGMAGHAKELEPPLHLGVALAAGCGAFFIVGWLMQSMKKLKADGTVRIDRAVGRKGTVYLTVPAQKAGLGKVTLNLQNRTVEYQALTAQQELATGSPIVVVSVVNSDTVEVASADGERKSL
jgi:hypothetical protein